ncbi:MAG: thioredoxin domain-containing protein, partial [Chloroflexi bacterium]|nr:thioredoxin domain-containing protein [Chloroflexota bacterium]
MPNRLIRETSPYLLQHADNPVDWYPWSPEAFERARREDMPVLLSIGYSACHWCHVMEHESFENPEIARLMNEHFVSVKVDREERPDLDSIYMAAVQALAGHGGWPMTVFLTPDGEPFYGGTYFPPHDRGAMPGFDRLLLAIADAYRSRRADVQDNASQLRQALARHAALQPSADLLVPEILYRAAVDLARHYDAQHGGFGGAPKFPQPMVLDFLLRLHVRTRDPRVLRMAEHTLERMARGGMYDHVGGGFHRYSTDPRWFLPHFEKMLYDQALLARTYVEAWQV